MTNFDNLKKFLILIRLIFLNKIFLTNHSNAWGKLSGDVDKVKKGSEVVLRAEKRSIFAIIWRFIESKFGL